MGFIKKQEIYHKFFDGGNGVAYIHVSEIDEIPEVNPNDWISVIDRLPESSCRCIIYAEGVVEYGYWDEVSSYNFSDGEIHYSKTGGMAFFILDKEDCLSLLNATHWMPLPDPPKEQT